MHTIAQVGVDLAKYLIQVHAVDTVGKVVTNRALKREKFLLWWHWALLYKSELGCSAPDPRRSYATRTVSGVPS
jgi:hypothetical protein